MKKGLKGNTGETNASPIRGDIKTEDIRLIVEKNISMMEVRNFIIAVIHIVQNCSSEDKSEKIREIINIAKGSLGFTDQEVNVESSQSVAMIDRQ